MAPILLRPNSRTRPRHLEFISIGGTSPRKSTVNAAKIDIRQDGTTAHNYENKPGLSRQHGM